MEDIWKLYGDLNIYSCHHVYRETDRSADCLVKKGIDIIDSRICLSTSLKMLLILALLFPTDLY